jgi:hypothetical protein
MAEYAMKRRQLFLMYVLFSIIAMFSFFSFFLYKNDLLIVSGVGSLVVLYFLVVVSKIKFITTDRGIKKRTFSGDQEIEWAAIYSVVTYRMASSGNYSTAIKWAKEPQYRDKVMGLKEIFEKNPKNGAIVVSDNVDGYSDLLKEISRKAINAKIDHTTEKILMGDK